MNSSNNKKIATISLTTILVLGIIPSMTSAFAFPPQRELCIALDRSGSIGESNWEDIILPGVRDALSDPDVKAGLVGKMVRLSLVTYATDVVLAVPPTDIGNDADVDDIVDLITAANMPFTGGGTNMEGAITKCKDQFSNFAGADQVIDIVTDGKPTVKDGVFSSECDSGSYPTACDTSTLGAGAAVRLLGVDKINVLAIGSFVSPPFNDALVADGGIVFDSPTIEDFVDAFTQKLRIETTENPVGGLILPIDSYSLVIAGLSTNPLWILPALAAVAGTSFALVRLQVTKKNN